MSKYGVTSSPYFTVFGLNAGKYRPEITPYLDTFRAVRFHYETRKRVCLENDHHKECLLTRIQATID